MIIQAAFHLLPLPSPGHFSLWWEKPSFHSYLCVRGHSGRPQRRWFTFSTLARRKKKSRAPRAPRVRRSVSLLNQSDLSQSFAAVTESHWATDKLTRRSHETVLEYEHATWNDHWNAVDNAEPSCAPGNSHLGDSGAYEKHGRTFQRVLKWC